MAALRAEVKGGGAALAAEARESPKPAAAKKPGAKPASTAGILAAARGEVSGGGGAAAAPVAAKPSAKPAVKKVPDGEKRSAQEMIAALRKPAGAEDKASPVVKSSGPAKPKFPKKPVAAGKPKAAKADDIPRRGFLLGLVATPLALAWTIMTATAGVSLLAVARFMFPNVLVEPPMRFKIGPPSDYPPGTVSTKFKAARGIWVVHTDQYKGRDLIYALASVCTHLGCTPSWLEGEQKFKCPCHGSGFYITGVNFEGPAPRPLERVGLAVAPDGMLEVDKSVKFQEEMGQWEDATSYVDASTV